MPYLALSGIPVPVSQSSGLRYSPVLLGEKVRTFNGFPRSSVRRKSMSYEGGTGPLPLADAAVLRALIDGEGDSWDFALTMASSRGLWPATSGAPWVVPSGVYDDGYALSLGVTDTVSWATQLGEAWTVAYWARVVDGTGAPWRHYLQRSDGSLSVDAVAPAPEGNAWTFETSLTSAQGLSPAGTTGTVTAGVDGPGRFGRCASITAGGTVRYATQLGTQWTVAYWARLSTSSTWTHYIHRPGLFISRDGVVGNATPNAGALYSSTGNYTQLPGGAVTLLCREGPGGGNPSNVPLLVDDLVVLPYTVPDSWVAPWYARGAPFGLPGTAGLASVDEDGSLTVRHVAAVEGGPANLNNGSIYVSDLVALPYLAPDAWLAPWRDAGAPFGPLPYHRATGTGLHRPALVLGDAGQGEALEWWDGPLRVQGEDFTFTLQEAP
ncbi:hypothetical protein [Corallococcus macrosporus]|uniref:Uncharacterized protein n=1 Tax=Myxococcus fulvus (strain ATCC BAA-855 / HW-1) TaxID=483219 RepID=F8CRL0_MYXFH|nr:hypothetical protein [Corallococcus macrosporus]AEI65555.1 hypothetical protein LILAB_18265 [Corallococcus macrosporus]